MSDLLSAGRCTSCGAQAHSLSFDGDEKLCDDCSEERFEAHREYRAEMAMRTADDQISFKAWLAEGETQGEPNDPDECSEPDGNQAGPGGLTAHVAMLESTGQCPWCGLEA